MLGCIRLSVLLLYRRVFYSNMVTWRRATTAAIVVGAISLIASEILLLFQCGNIRITFDVLARIKSQCFNPQISTYLSIIHIVLYFIVMVLPIPCIWKLQMPLRDRVKIIMLLCLGVFIFAFPILRLLYYYKLEQDKDMRMYNSCN